MALTSAQAQLIEFAVTEIAEYVALLQVVFPPIVSRITI